MASDFLLTPATRLTLPTLRTLLAGNAHIALNSDSALPAATPAAPATNSPLWALACGTGAEVPAPLVRLMLLLHAHQQLRRGAPAATVRRLLDFYNREVLPIVYQQGGDRVTLAHLSLPLFGLGEVNYQGYRLHTHDVLELFGWAPLPLIEEEVGALLDGTAFTLAYALHAWLRAEHLLALADELAALTLATVQSVAELPHTVAQLSQHADCHTALTYVQHCLEEACYALPTHLTSTNLPSPTTPDAVLALHTLLPVVAELGSRSARRTELLLRHAAPALVSLRYPVGSLLRQNQQLCSPTLAGNGSYDSPSAEAARSAYALVENVEQLLGIELVFTTQQVPSSLPAQLPVAAAQLVAAFRGRMPAETAQQPLYPILHAAARFVREYVG